MPSAEPYAPDVPHPGKTYRATHRVETPGLPPLYALREADALQAAEERGRPDTVISICIVSKTGDCSWEPWRTWP